MAWEPTKLRLWHQTLMDFLLLRPEATADEAALHFGCGVQTVRLVIGSDLFQAQLAERRERMAKAVEEAALEKIGGKVEKLADISLDILNDRLERERKLLGLGNIGTMSIDGVVETASMALKALGFGQPGATPQAPGPTNVIFVDKDMLAEARRRMRGEEIVESQDALPAAS